MDYTQSETRLIDAMSNMDIIDCHEHLPSEQLRTGERQDVFILFSNYLRFDARSAGMDRDGYNACPGSPQMPQYESLFDRDIPLDKRWELFRPYWENIRFGSYARSALLAAKLVYGIDDINDNTYHELSERISAANTPGIYRRILCDRCRIRSVLNQGETTDVEPPLVSIMPAWSKTPSEQRLNPFIAEAISEHGVRTRSLEDCLELCRRQLDTWVDQRAVGIKIMSKRTSAPDPKAAQESLQGLLDGRKYTMDSHDVNPLENYLTHSMIDMAAERDMVIAVHSGIWGDFRNLDCKHTLALAPAHPHAGFDLYHLGMPSVRDAIVIAKNLPNVFLNLCWTHVISQTQACSGIDELLDQVPVNKILAFGGDYVQAVEKVVGHLHIAKENCACVFGRRIDRGMIGFDDAVTILKRWFWDNPLKLYTRLPQVQRALTADRPEHRRQPDLNDIHGWYRAISDRGIAIMRLPHPTEAIMNGQYKQEFPTGATLSVEADDLDQGKRIMETVNEG